MTLGARRREVAQADRRERDDGEVGRVAEGDPEPPRRDDRDEEDIPPIPNQRLDENVELRRFRAHVVAADLAIHPRHECEEVVAEDREDKREPGNPDDGDVARQSFSC